MASALSISLSPLLSSTINSSPSVSSSSFSLSYPFLSLLPCTHFTSSAIRIQASSRGLTSTDSSSSLYPLWSNTRNPNKLICRAAEYKFPDPIPEFAEEVRILSLHTHTYIDIDICMYAPMTLLILLLISLFLFLNQILYCRRQKNLGPICLPNSPRKISMEIQLKRSLESVLR